MASIFKKIAENRKARRDFEINEVIEAGIILKGSEVKSLRIGKASIAESYATEENGVLALINANIPEYSSAREKHGPSRIRPLLLRKKELHKLLGLIKREGITIVPLTLYFNEKGKVKLKIGLAKGRKKQDLRQVDKKRDWERQRHRLLKQGN